MKKYTYILVSLFIIAFSACKNVATINESEAGEVIVDYLKGNPEYKTDKFHFGEMRFNSKKDMLELEKYKTLANEGFISLALQEGKKKFLSKDSSFVYIIKLTDKASDLVLKQDDTKATVKVVNYELASEKPVNFSRVNDNNAKVTVSLKKVNTVFAPFQKDNNDNSDFITKTYRLKLDKEEGWKVNK
ncbi:hypothetical protein FA048_00105 [Pedobacter polaris]|uniref:Lipoprotein n=1 Tax=Pedobacter polaris TaxID=2571273 RepID=A0A4U1CSE3_9SPHI|nr:hypothetical protein [Pedobacter polaris]TKC12057.1 hypothetical protein FA048_00105 [Pedobacter polaris]